MSDDKFKALCNTFGFAPSRALRLANSLAAHSLSRHGQTQAAAELRRLHEANEAFGKRQEWWNERMFVLEQQRDALLEALKAAEPYLRHADVAYNVYVQARAAIKAAEENT